MPMGALFGTDGVRGLANEELSPELAFKLGRAGAFVLQEETGARALVIGRDTRLSGDMLEAALVAGICSVGVDVIRVGVLPTPAIAYLSRAPEAGGGVVISASHNPYEDNGIKFFGANGYKLPDRLEDRIEHLVLTAGGALPTPSGIGVGRVREMPDAMERYVRFACGTGPSDLAGLKIVVDCANGAAYQVAPQVLGRLGASVVPLFDTPDGTNINAGCGSTHPHVLQQAVPAEGADLGLAFDGDADRLIAVDEHGRLVDGDHLLVICGRHMRRHGRLAGNTMVVTVMSNLGLHLALREAGIRVLQTKVGDRYVLEEMLRSGCCLGGEQSGHIIFTEYNTTGDGIITALQLLKVMRETGRPLSQLAAQMERLPQLLENVRVRDRNAVMSSPALWEAIARYEHGLNGEGRILVRPSGTEPLVRVMAEARNETLLTKVVEELVRVVTEIDRQQAG
ncbi:phosphoglucosamine mutase [Candidatus Desulforudis audaxviator MP104C]|nr:phosphoglucosamine mutase [Candidatus Desulforudis audaxviator MP104C]AZK58937.1 Phosphoglucosamine mutase [Candidatus Desulforudis audaxviator]